MASSGSSTSPAIVFSKLMELILMISSSSSPSTAAPHPLPLFFDSSPEEGGCVHCPDADA